MTLAFLPVGRDALAAWATDGVLRGPTTAFAVTTAFMDAFGYDSPTDEHAEHEVLRAASVQALIDFGRRLVVVADVPVEAAGDVLGRVQVGDAAFDTVLSIFRDDAQAAEATALAPAVSGMTLDEALDMVDVQQMLSDVELLWYGPTEWPEACDD